MEVNTTVCYLFVFKTYFFGKVAVTTLGGLATLHGFKNFCYCNFCLLPTKKPPSQYKY